MHVLHKFLGFVINNSLPREPTYPSTKGLNIWKKVLTNTHTHEKRVAVVNWISELKRKDCVRTDRVELGAQLGRRQTEVIKPVIPTDAIKCFDVATDEPITRG